MALDPQVTEPGVRLADVGVRNTVAAVSGRIMAAKAKRQDAETINVLTEIVNDLLADKNDLVQIARGYEQASQLIGSNTPAAPGVVAEAQRLSLELQLAMASLVQDEQAYQRFRSLSSPG